MSRSSQSFWINSLWIWVRRFLAALGLLFIVYAVVVIYTLTTNDVRYDFSGRQHISGQLFKAGIEDIQGDSLKFGSINSHPFFGEYEMMFCVDLKSFTLRESSKRHWLSYNDEELRAGLGSFMEMYEVTNRCFGDSSNTDSWTATVIDTRQHDDGYISGFDLLIHDSVTNRLAFYGFET